MLEQRQLDTPERPRLLFILGMHRSGTSALGGILSQRGVFLGDHLITGNRFNPKGFFERPDVVVLNEWILRRARCAWDNIPGNSVPRLRLWERLYFSNRIARLIGKTVKAHPVSGLKDPRLAVTFRLWGRQARRFADTRCVLMLRHPDEVVASLARRNGFSAEKGALLWLQYNVAAIASTADYARELVFFDDLLRDEQGVLGRLSGFLGLPSNNSNRRGLTFVEARLQHHVAAETRGNDDESELLSAARDCFLAVRRDGFDLGAAQMQGYRRVVEEYGDSLP